jgi:hypothetical protein
MMNTDEVAKVYAQFPWLEKIHSQAEAKRVSVENVRDVSVFRKVSSAYLVQAPDGNFDVIKYLWPGAYVFSGYREAQWQGMPGSTAYAVLVENGSVTIFCNLP